MFRIMAIDDNEEILSIVKTYLEANGFEVLTLNDPSLALQQIEEFKPGLVLLDVMMPHITGIEICRDIKNNIHTKEIKVLFLTVKDIDLAKEMAMESGGDGYIIKPFSPEELLTQIQSVLKN